MANSLTPSAIQVNGFQYVPAYMGDEGLVVQFTEGAAQSFKAGDPVKLSGGKIIAATATANNLDAAQVLVGFAMQKATGVTDAACPVRVIRPSTDVFIVNLDPTATANTFVTTMVGSTIGISQVGTEWFADGDQVPGVPAGDTYVQVLASAEWGEIALTATVGGPIYVKFLEAQTIFVD